MFDLPNRAGFVAEVGPGEYPSPHDFHRLYAPTVDAQKRSIDCQAAIDKACGKKKGMSAAQKVEREKCYLTKRESLWWPCNDVTRGSPLVLRGYAKSAPAFTHWATDSLLVQSHGSVRFSGVEIGARRETRRHEMGAMTLAEFVEAKTNDTDIRAHYVVDPVPRPMLDDLVVPDILRCGGATEGTIKLYLWMSAGGTESVLHNDQYDNLNCVYAGSKRFYIAHARYVPVVTDPKCGWVDVNREIQAMAQSVATAPEPEADLRKQLGYGSFARELNVSAVDMVKLPCWAHIEWREAVVNAGDCLYIPQWHYHHVQSTADPDGRNIATNLWWKRLAKFNPAQGFGCDVDGSPVTMTTLHREKKLNRGT